MRALIILVGYLLLPAILWAQFDKDYTPIKYTGTIPAEFLEKTREKTESEIKSNKEDLGKKQSKEFYVVQNYSLQSVFQSGVVYFNDEITQYVNDVADKLLAHNPELRKQVRFYVTRSQVPNAFAWRDGSIFINIGLLRYLENEAQLAYIMAHEVQHYLKEHALMQFKKEKDLESVFSKQSEMDAFMAKMKYSREHELEADAEGFELYSKSGYKLSEASKALGILKIVDGDFYSDSLNLLEVFSTETFKVDSSWLCTDEELVDLADVGYESSRRGREADDNARGSGKSRTRNTVSDQYETAEDREEEEEDDEELEEDIDDTLDEDDDEDSKYSTHPSLTKRLKELDKMFAEKGGDAGEHYLVSESRFNRMRQVVTFEVVNEYLKDAAYFRSLYESLQLQKQYPENEFLSEVTSQSLFWIAYFFDLNSVDEIMDDYEQYSGQEFGTLLCFFDYIEEDDMIDLATAYLNACHEKFPDNGTIEVTLARLLPLNKKSKDAKDIYKDYAKKHPDSVHKNFTEAMKKRKKL